MELQASHDSPVSVAHEDTALEPATWGIQPSLSPDIHWPTPGLLEDQDFLDWPGWLDSANSNHSDAPSYKKKGRSAAAFLGGALPHALSHPTYRKRFAKVSGNGA